VALRFLTSLQHEVFNFGPVQVGYHIDSATSVAEIKKVTRTRPNARPHSRRIVTPSAQGPVNAGRCSGRERCAVNLERLGLGGVACKAGLGISPSDNMCNEQFTVARRVRSALGKNTSAELLRFTAVRRVHLRENLKPVKAYWAHSDQPRPDWLVITHTTGQRSFETFDLHLLKVMAPACDGCKPSVVNAGSMSYETLRIAKAQAHADLGVEYVEWEPCSVEITNEDGSIEWSRALPRVEQQNTKSVKA